MSSISTAKYDLLANRNSTHERVESLLFTSLENSMKGKAEIIKIGIEVEFFLMGLTGEPVCMAESNEFMHSVSELNGWRVYDESETKGAISKVSFEVPGGGYHSLKYEHPPHMLEVAFAPFSNLHDLYDSVLHVWNDFEIAAQICKIKLVFKPRINAPVLNWAEITAFNPKYEALKITREHAVGAFQSKEKWVHFSTYTASTQFHIGGSRWWRKDRNFVEKLYRAELLTGTNAQRLLDVKKAGVSDAFFNRWNGYFEVFKNLELVGFPNFDCWTVQTWVESFCKSSLVLLKSDPFFGKDLNRIAPVLSDGELADIIQMVRDLQIVRPKLFGTLEFRADPALPSPEAIIRQAALRFGIYHHCLKRGPEPLASVSFAEIGDRWRRGLDIKGVEKELDDLREDAFNALKARGLGEEGLL